MKEIECPNCHTKIKLENDVLNEIKKQLIDEQKQLFEQEKKILINQKEQEKTSLILQNKNELKSQELEFQQKIQNIKNQYHDQIAQLNHKLEKKDQEIERVKDSIHRNYTTVQIGQDLENWCLTEFNYERPRSFRNDTFEKDTLGDSKGDFIFRAFDENKNEYVSIMFEMKNEIPNSKWKHKNEHFFAKLDKDRKNKNCEYAILVSTLEPDNKIYNAGIADVSHEYEKMYVVRPEFFITIISLIKNEAMNRIKLQRQIAIMEDAHLDEKTFLQNLNDFKQKALRNYDFQRKNVEQSIKNINLAIKQLENTRDALQKSLRYNELAFEKVDDLSIKKLTKGAPRMAEKFRKITNEEYK